MVVNKKPPRLFLMESLRNKILSECSNVPCRLYLGHGDHINRAEKEDDCSTKQSSSSPTKNGSANVFLKTPGTLKSTLAENHPVPLGNATDLTPNEGEAEAKLNGDKTPDQIIPSVDFSALTAANFGITPESFTRQKMESKSLLKKFRRRSTIGVRGSPENNSLIRYIARQKRTKMEKPLLQASPFKHHSVLLKDKIAAFQSSFKPLEETEERQVQIPNTFKEGGPGPKEQSSLGQGCAKSLAVEEDLNSPSINGKRTSADLPVCNMVSPLQEPLTPGTAIVSKAVPALEPKTAESQCLPSESTPEADVSRTGCGIQSRCIDEELSSSAASQQSCKKVRFAEKESLEIFDKSKPPITPLQKGQLPSCVLYRDGTCLRSVLKKPPEQFDRSREGSEASLAFKTCGPLQIESNTSPVGETEEDSEDLDAEVLATLPLVGTPLLVGVGSCSPSGSRNNSTITPLKQLLSQPNFDIEDELPPGSSEAVPTTECAVNSDLEEPRNHSPDPQATCCRITRSCLKRKLDIRAAETDTHLPIKIQSRRASSSKVPKPSKVKKANSKKTPASKHKVFGRRRRRKKEQKALYGQRETVSKKPLLSPIPEMKEDLSFASCWSTPRSQISILDYSNSSDDCVEYVDKTARKESSALQNPIADSSGLNLSLDLGKEGVLPDVLLVSSQLQEAITTVGENAGPRDLLEKNSPEKLKSTMNTNQQVLRSDRLSNETEMQKELEFVSGDMMGEKKAGRGEPGLTRDSASELTSVRVDVNFKRVPRRSSRLSCCLPNIDNDQSERPGNNVCVPGSSLEELRPTPQTVDHSVLLNDLQHSIEESFRSVLDNNKKRVRRSTRRLKDAECSGLAWFHVPADNFTSQAILGCDSKAQRQTHPSNPEELAPRMLLSMEEEQANAPVGMGPGRSKAGRRRSICALSLENDRNVVLPHQRIRRASLGYRSDQCYRKDSEIRKLLANQQTAVF